MRQDAFIRDNIDGPRMKKESLMEIWIPDSVYLALPWVCIGAASVIWFIPLNPVSITCSAVLYAYACWILVRRVLG